MSVRRSLFVLILILMALPSIVYSRIQTRNPSNTVDLSSLQLYQIMPDTVALTVNAIGQIEPDQQINLSFLTAGQVDTIYIERDDYVLEGDLLISLDNDIQRIAYEQALISLERAELAYQDLQTPDETAIILAQTAVDSARAAYYSATSAVSQSDINAASLSYEQALERADALRIERDNIGGLFGGDSIEWQQANARYGEATFQAEIARVRIDQVRNAGAPQANAAYARWLQAIAEFEQVQAGATTTELETSQIQIEQAQNQVERAANSFQQTQLTAPFTGVITALNTQIGGLVAPGLTVVELTDISPLTLVVQVDEVDIGLVEIGYPVRVILDALPDVTLEAVVSEIAPLGTPAGGIVSYEVRIDLLSEDERVRVGMTADATIIIQETTDVLAVPNLYVRRDRATEKSFVNVLRDDDTLQEVEIVTGIQGRDKSEVLSGLESGDLVVIDLSGGGVNFFGGDE